MSEATFTVEQALDLADDWEASGQLPAPLIVDLAREVRRLLAMERRAHEVLDGGLTPGLHDDDVARYILTGEA